MTIKAFFHLMFLFHHPFHYFFDGFNLSNSNWNDEDFVFYWKESCTPCEKGLPIAQSKLRVKKKNYDATTKFQDFWVVRLPWWKSCVGSNGNLHTVKCKICNEVEGTNKLLFPKWDYLYKHVGCKKVEKNIRIDVKKRDWYYSKVSKHAKNKKNICFF
jgi:hypothetical protein